MRPDDEVVSWLILYPPLSLQMASLFDGDGSERDDAVTGPRKPTLNDFSFMDILCIKSLMTILNLNRLTM